MPLQQILPTWVALNNANFPTPSGLQDLRTGQDFPAGGLNLGDYFDLTEQEANSASALNVGLCHHGRYRLVRVDSGATVANVKTGTIGYIRAGTFVQSATTLTAGSGQTPGTYNVAATPGSGGGSGAVIQVVVTAAGTVTAPPVVIAGGQNYFSVPTFTLVTGGTPATVAAQLNSTPNVVTSYDQASTQKSLVREVVFLNPITPGNCGFIQEMGLATLLSSGAITANNWVNSAASGLAADGGSGGPTIATVAQSIDPATAANQLFKAYLTSSAVQD